MKTKQTQVIINESNNKFVIASQRENVKKIICPFYYSSKKYQTKVVFPKNRKYRLDQIKQILNFSTINYYSEDKLIFDCLQSIDEVFFHNIKSGIIMIDVNNICEISNDKKILQAEEKLVLNQTVNEEEFQFKIQLSNNYYFQTKKKKVLPILFDDGFALSIIENNDATMYLTIKDPKKSFINITNTIKSCKFISFYMGVWPIFNININNIDKTPIYINYIDKYIDSYNQPILIKLTRNLLDFNGQVRLKIVGENYKLPQDS